MKLASTNAVIESRRLGRRMRVRKKVRGSQMTPRLAVFRSNRYISAQLINDEIGKTIVAVNSKDAGLAIDGSKKTKTAASAVGAKLAELAKQQGIESVVFDKGWYKYHGRVRALAEAAREAGLKF